MRDKAKVEADTTLAADERVRKLKDIDERLAELGQQLARAAKQGTGMATSTPPGLASEPPARPGSLLLDQDMAILAVLWRPVAPPKTWA